MHNLKKFHPLSLSASMIDLQTVDTHGPSSTSSSLYCVVMNREQWSHYFAHQQQQQQQELSSSSCQPPPPSEESRPFLDPQAGLSYAYLSGAAMTPLGSAMANASNNAGLHHHQQHSDEGRIPAEDLLLSVPRATMSSSRTMGYQSTPDGDILIVQPSFDDPGSRKSPLTVTKTTTTATTTDDDLVVVCQTRSPSHDQPLSGGRVVDREERNPISPRKSSVRHGGGQHHSRNLSAHFFDATSLKDKGIGGEQLEEEGGGGGPPSRKHRRIFSGDLTNPTSQLHRRLNSRGGRGAVMRRSPTSTNDGGRFHHREDSAGLDILSAAAGATAEELAAAAGAIVAPQQQQPRSSPTTGTPYHASWEGPPPSESSRPPPPLGQQSSHESEYDQPTGYTMPPPPHPPRSAHNSSSMSSYPTTYLHSQGLSPYHPAQGHYPYHPHHPPPYYGHHHPGSSGGLPSHPSARPYGGMPPQQQHQPPPPEMHHRAYSPEQQCGRQLDSWPAIPSDAISENRKQLNHHQGSLAAGAGGKTLQPTTTTSTSKNASTNTGSGAGPDADLGAVTNTQMRHHRKMSSYSSIGTLLGPNIFSPTDSDKQGHHRKTSSSLSFLQGLDVGLDHADDSFLKNLQASYASVAGVDFRAPTPQQQQQHVSMHARTASSASVLSPNSSLPLPLGSDATTATAAAHNRMLSVASSKKALPTIPVSSEPLVDESEDSGWESGSRLASGGTSKRLRRKCTVEGCENRVVQGGLCISHGARRKTCKHPGCPKNVKKAGLCSTHGPARKRCEFDGCTKVAVQGGRCIAHGAKKKLCSNRGCTKQAILNGMCKKHHDQASARAGNSSATPASARKEAKWDGPPHAVLCQEIKSGTTPSKGTYKPSHTRGLSIFQETPLDMLSSVLNEPQPNEANTPPGDGQPGGYM